MTPLKRKKRICGQARVSSQKQKDEATIEDQIKFLRDLFTSMGIFDGTNAVYEFVPYDPDNHTPENPSFFVDEAYNIEEEDRSTKFFELMKRVDCGEIDVVATYANNRIFRSQDEVFRAKIVKCFRLAGAKIFVNGGERNPSDLASLVEQHLSAEEKTRILRNCHRGKKRRSEKEGAPPSGQPKFGFRWLSHRLDRRWIENSEETSLVRWMGCLSGGIIDPSLPAVFAQALTEKPLGCSDAEIVDLLKVNGFSIMQHFEECRLVKQLEKNPTGVIKEAFVQRILSDATYSGAIQYRFKMSDEIRQS